MRRALDVAKRAPAGDVPVGAVLYDATGTELATGVNRREELADPTAHAEVEAIRQAVRVHGDGWRLSGCELVVTLEPCAMCAGALQAARVSSVVFGAFEPKTGACGSLIDVLRAPTAPFTPQVRGGVLEGECAGLLRKFFDGLR
ncbi:MULTISPECIES: nucleoside deaminase [Corynebacterium]|uniref:nucleoside deaminase n=1 Tax=Corynebacterium TaxID=1716 RepID=UPI00066EE2EB|nr:MULTISPECIES: nucleoside deaminase [unclassified Corynebacterium]MDU1462177.1 nucleoside deaminase [Corynebacterium sp.]MDU5016991.1 nucleoside deaminase [Corynebacterium sp.]